MALVLDNLKEALVEEFVKKQDPEKLWQEVKAVMQREGELVGDYIDPFSSLWEDLSKALQPQVPPKMMKKDQFLIGLRADLLLRVELKKLRSYEEAMEIAKRKKWKLSMMSKMGVTYSLPLPMEMRKPKPVVQRVPMEVLQQAVLQMVPPVVQPVVPIMAARVVADDGLQQEMRQVVDLMKNLSLNLLSNVGNQGRGRSSNQPNGNGGQGNGGRKWRNMPTF